MKAIVTGSNGFIGFNLCQALEQRNWEVMGIDDLLLLQTQRHMQDASLWR